MNKRNVKKKSAFTLIELLAVIVILAIIALIVTPAIINVIENARKKAFEDTAYGVLEGLRLDYTERSAKGDTSETKFFTFPKSGLKLSGEEPAGGNAKIDINGKISFTLFDKDKRWCAEKKENYEKVIVSDYSEENCKIDGSSGENHGGEVTSAIADGTVVYFDPIKGEKCNTYVSNNSFNEIKTGCMKFYTFGGNNASSSVNLLLDHNTTYKVAYNLNNDNTNSTEIDSKLKEDTQGWIGNPRLITADEIAKITGHKTFNSNKENDIFCFDTLISVCDQNTGKGNSKYKWLFDYTEDCIDWGCSKSDLNTDGYWTSTKSYSDVDRVWAVFKLGQLTRTVANPNEIYSFGIRPVITIEKSIL